MTLHVLEEIIDPGVIAQGKLGATKIFNLICSSQLSVQAKTISSVWIEWVETGSGITVSKDGGVAVNGETITELTNYTVDLLGYQSPNATLNTSYSQVNFTLRDADGGNILDSQSVSRFRGDGVCVL